MSAGPVFLSLFLGPVGRRDNSQDTACPHRTHGSSLLTNILTHSGQSSRPSGSVQAPVGIQAVLPAHLAAACSHPAQLLGLIGLRITHLPHH